MSLTVGELQVLLSGDPSKLNRELDRVDARAGQTEKVHTAAWSRIGAVAGTALKAGALLATAATIGVGAALRSTVKIGMEYQDQLNTLGAVSGATAQQMEQVASVAKTLGGDLTLPATSAADAAAAMTELAKGGLKVDEAMAAAKGTLQLAAAAQISAGQAAEYQAQTLNSFSLKADQATRVADVLANVANAASGEISDFALGMAQASAVSAAMGISLEDTAATLGLLAKNGIMGSDAGTLLKSALLALQSPSTAASKAMGRLKLDAYDAAGNFVGLSSVFDQLAEAQRNMTPEAYAMATSTLFGSDAARLAGIAGKEGAEGFDLMREAMGKQGAAADVAAAKAKGLRGAYEGLQSQVETLKIQGFEALSPAMESVVRKASDMVPMLGQHLFSAMEKAIGGAQELREEFGPEMAELGEIAAQKWGQFVDLLSELGSAVAPSLPSLIDSLLRIAQVGGEVGEAMLPALEAGLRLAGPAADALAGTLGIVASVLEAIEPILPLVVGGFLAFKGISAGVGALQALSGVLSPMSGGLARMAQNAAFATYEMDGLGGRAAEKMHGGLSKAAGAVSKIGGALPAVGLAVGLVGLAMETADRQATEWAQALLDGGRAADTARQEMAELSEAWTNWEELPAAANLAPGMRAFADAMGIGGDAAERAAVKSRELQAAMTPLQLAQQIVTNRTNELTRAQEDYGVNSWQAAAASDALRVAQTNLETKERDLAAATETATSKLLAQTQAAMAGANADLALSMANTQLTTAMETYKTSLADGTLTTTQRQQATDAMTQSSLSAAQAAGAQAFAHSTAATEEGKQAEADAALLASLKATAQQLGSKTPAAISQLIGSLEGSTSASAVAAAQMRDLGFSVEEIPGSKDVIVKAPTADQKRRLEELGRITTTLPNGNIRVTADTGPALNSIIALTRRSFAAQVSVNAVGGLFGGPRASGGPVAAKIPYLVGEEGQELFVPDQPGTIISADKTAAMLAAAGNRRAAAMLPGLGATANSRGMSSAGGSTGTGSASVGGVTEKHTHYHAAVRAEVTMREFMSLEREKDALYG